jgi:hypothetical protein
VKPDNSRLTRNLHKMAYVCNYESFLIMFNFIVFIIRVVIDLVKIKKKSRWVVELCGVTEVTEEIGRGLNAGSILIKSTAGRRNR